MFAHEEGHHENFTRNLGKVCQWIIIITTAQRAEFVIIALMNKEGISSRKVKRLLRKYEVMIRRVWLTIPVNKVRL